MCKTTFKQYGKAKKKKNIQQKKEIYQHVQVYLMILLNPNKLHPLQKTVRDAVESL